MAADGTKKADGTTEAGVIAATANAKQVAHWLETFRGGRFADLVGTFKGFTGSELYMLKELQLEKYCGGPRGCLLYNYLHPDEAAAADVPGASASLSAAGDELPPKVVAAMARIADSRIVASNAGGARGLSISASTAVKHYRDNRIVVVWELAQIQKDLGERVVADVNRALRSPPTVVSTSEGDASTSDADGSPSAGDADGDSEAKGNEALDFGSIWESGEVLSDKASEEDIQKEWANDFAKSCAAFVTSHFGFTWVPKDTHKKGPNGIRNGLKPDITFYFASQGGQYHEAFVGCNVWDVKAAAKLGGDAVVHQALGYLEAVRDATLEPRDSYYSVFVSHRAARLFKFVRTPEVGGKWQLWASGLLLFPAALPYILALMREWAPVELYSDWPKEDRSWPAGKISVTKVLGTGATATVVQLEVGTKTFAAKMPTPFLVVPAIMTPDERKARKESVERTTLLEAERLSTVGHDSIAAMVPKVSFVNDDLILFDSVYQDLQMMSRDDVSNLFKVLRRAQSVGIVHRDIRPENVMMSASGLVLIDWAYAVQGVVSDTEPPHFEFGAVSYCGAIGFASERILQLLADGDSDIAPSFADDIESAALVCLYYAVPENLRAHLRETPIEKECTVADRARTVLKLRNRLPLNWQGAIEAARAGSIDKTETCVLATFTQDYEQAAGGAGGQ